MKNEHNEDDYLIPPEEDDYLLPHELDDFMVI